MSVPFLRLIDEVGGDERFEIHSEGNSLIVTDYQTGVELFRIESNQSQVFIPQRKFSIGGNGSTATDFNIDSSGNFTLVSKGSIKLQNSGGTIWTWPSSDGTSGQVIQTNGAGVLSFVTASGGNPAGTGSEVQYRSTGTTFGAVTNSSVSGANVTLGGTLTLNQNAQPSITLTPTSGNSSELSTGNGFSEWRDSTSGGEFVRFEASGASFFPQTGIATFSGNLDISKAVPVLRLSDTGQSTFELYVDRGSSTYQDATTGNTVFRYEPSGYFFLYGGSLVLGNSGVNSVDFLNSSGNLTISPKGGSLTFSNLLTNGGILYTNGSGLVAQTATGNSGQVLTSNGAGSAPTFQAAAGGGISTVGDVTSGSVAFEGTVGKTLTFTPASGAKWEETVGPGYLDFVDTTNGKDFFRMETPSGNVFLLQNSLILGTGGTASVGFSNSAGTLTISPTANSATLGGSLSLLTSETITGPAPSITWTDNSGAQKDGFEASIDSSTWYLTDLTTGNRLLQFNSDAKGFFPQGYVVIGDGGTGSANLRMSGNTLNIEPAGSGSVAVSTGMTVGGSGRSFFGEGLIVNNGSGTASKDQFNMPSAAFPTASQTEGDLGNDATQKAWKTYVDGVNQVIPGTLFTATAGKTVANTLIETSLVGTGVGTVTLPANFFVAGKTVRLSMSGYIANTATPTIRIKAKLGTTVICDTTAATTSTITGTTLFEAEFIITCRSTGASGTVYGQGHFDYYTGLTSYQAIEAVQTAATTVDTTASQAVDISCTWGAASASNTITATNFSLMAMN